MAATATGCNPAYIHTLRHAAAIITARTGGVMFMIMKSDGQKVGFSVSSGRWSFFLLTSKFPICLVANCDSDVWCESVGLSLSSFLLLLWKMKRTLPASSVTQLQRCHRCPSPVPYTVTWQINSCVQLSLFPPDRFNWTPGDVRWLGNHLANVSWLCTVFFFMEVLAVSLCLYSGSLTTKISDIPETDL